MTNKDDFRCFVPCNCSGECERFEKKNVISDAIEMRVTGEIVIKALAAVSVITHKKMIEEEEYFLRYYDFIENKDSIIPYKEDSDTIREDDNVNDEDDDSDDAECQKCGLYCTGTFLVLFILFLFALAAAGQLKI